MDVLIGRILLILAFLVIADAGVYAIFARDLSDACSRLVGRNQTIDTSFGTLECALTIHGGSGGFDQVIDMTEAERGYRLIAPYRFGYLGSTLPANLTTAMQTDAYVEPLDRFGIDKPFLLSISAGAWSAMQFAIRHPERCRAPMLLGTNPAFVHAAEPSEKARGQQILNHILPVSMRSEGILFDMRIAGPDEGTMPMSGATSNRSLRLIRAYSD